MKKTPVRGMRDILPTDMIIREYLLNIIEDAAVSAGYQKIETPAIEHLENLSNKDGGENETLIFKILKRGQSLQKSIDTKLDLADSALRYDLTVPLARYFAANTDGIPTPFKALQIGPVWRADAPQKGRFRQFLQCDMDILGDSSILAEIDIITTTVKILSKICDEAKITGLTVHLNDRRILLAAAKYAGFSESDYGSVLISLDKNDKIGLNGVKTELERYNLDAFAIEKFIELFKKVNGEISVVEFCELLGNESPEKSVLDDLKIIMAAVNKIDAINAKIIFDPTLVRGMGYYTGPIFECSANGLKSSIAGGGRYDKMIGKFSGSTNIAACGFSIGFERMATILSDSGFTPITKRDMIAILVDRNISSTKYGDIIKNAEEMRKCNKIVSVIPMARNISRQIELLEKNGYSQFKKIYNNNL
jgi:histidyl-tRNA synthetase